MSLSNEFAELSSQYRIAPAVIDYLAESYPSERDMRTLMHAISTAPENYFLRINLTKITPVALLDLWKEHFPAFQGCIDPLPNTLKIPIKGVFNPPLLKTRVYCDKFAAESVMIGADLFMPGVTGMNGKFSCNKEVSILLSPSHIPKTWKIDPESLHVANGVTRKTSKQYVTERKGIFVENNAPRYIVPKYRNHPIYQNGLVSGQNVPPNYAMACLIGTAFAQYKDRPDNVTILDLCAAPGHKSTAMVEWSHYYSTLENLAWHPPILSIDRSANRLRHLTKDMTRLGLSKITPWACKVEKIVQERPTLKHAADVVMFDPPCSALGTRPKLFIEENNNRLTGYAKNQSRLLPFVDELIKPEGFLMYNTCTLAQAENEEIVNQMITDYHYELCPLTQYLPKTIKHVSRPALPTSNLSTRDLGNMCRFSPTSGDMSGYFIALLKKHS